MGMATAKSTRRGSMLTPTKRVCPGLREKDWRTVTVKKCRSDPHARGDADVPEHAASVVGRLLLCCLLRCARKGAGAERGLNGICRVSTRKAHTAARRAIRSSEGGAFGIRGIWLGSRSSIAARRRGRPGYAFRTSWTATSTRCIGNLRSILRTSAEGELRQPLSPAWASGPATAIPPRGSARRAVRPPRLSLERTFGLLVPNSAGSTRGSCTGEGVWQSKWTGCGEPREAGRPRGMRQALLSQHLIRKETEKWETMGASGGRAIADGQM